MIIRQCFVCIIVSWFVSAVLSYICGFFCTVIQNGNSWVDLFHMTKKRKTFISLLTSEPKS
uniref:Uncharacterized protein n=1 Tax=Arundo donax TaxID=35708 RepID=A0A0A9D8H5_ARUDO